MTDWKPIESAPRDGTMIYIADPDVGAFPMRWNAEGYNDVFAPHNVGIWETVNGVATWSEREGFGPTMWKHIEGGCDGWDTPLQEGEE